jgi:hypothetical protein
MEMFLYLLKSVICYILSFFNMRISYKILFFVSIIILNNFIWLARKLGIS